MFANHLTKLCRLCEFAASSISQISRWQIGDWVSREIPFVTLDRYEMIKQLMQHNIPALESQDAQTAHAVATPKPTNFDNMTVSAFHTRFTIWPMVENQAGRTHREEDHFAQFTQEFGKNQNTQRSFKKHSEHSPWANTFQNVTD